MSDATTHGEQVSGKVEGRLGVKLYFEWHPAPDARGALTLIHGFGEHIGRYGHVFEALNEAGVSVLGLDVRGHGQSEGRRAFLYNFGEYIDDVDVALRLTRERAEGLPLFLLGHSQGGLVVAAYAVERCEASCELAGLVLSSPGVRFKVQVPAWKDALGRAMSKAWPSLAIPSGLDPAFLSHDTAIVEAYKADPLVATKATARWYTESLDAQQHVLQRASHIRLPVLVLQAGDDQIVDPLATRSLFERLGSEDKEYKEYPGFYHEIFNETERARVLADLVAWLKPRLADA